MLIHILELFSSIQLFSKFGPYPREMHLKFCKKKENEKKMKKKLRIFNLGQFQVILHGYYIQKNQVSNIFFDRVMHF